MYTGPQSMVFMPGPCDLTGESFRKSFKPFYENPDAYAMEPFRIHGNLYYVGDQFLCMHLIDTGDGLLLIDCGYGQTTHMIEQSIEKLGFDCHDLKWIIVTHGHFDHFGSGDALRQKYGCKIYMSRVDTDLLREDPRRALTDHGPHPMDVCWPDEVIDDGQVLQFGSVPVRCVLAPGHTYGVMAFFFPVGDLIAGTWGGTGLSGMYGDKCRYLGLPAEKGQAMLKTIQKLRGEKVDINLGNHLAQNCTKEKRAWMVEHPEDNPFINENGWGIMLDTVEERLKEFMELGYDK